MNRVRVPHPKRTGFLPFYFMLCVASLAAAVPQATATAFDSGGVLRLTVTAKGFPEIKSVALTFGYDPLRVDIGNATVCAAVPSSALGASCDTTHKTFVLTLTAASTVIIADGSNLAVLRAPEHVGSAMTHAIQLSSAVATDKSGATMTVLVTDGGTRLRLYPQSTSVSCAFAEKRIFTLDGRSCSATGAALPRGCFIICTGEAAGIRHATAVLFISGREARHGKHLPLF